MGEVGKDIASMQEEEALSTWDDIEAMLVCKEADNEFGQRKEACAA